MTSSGKIARSGGEVRGGEFGGLRLGIVAVSGVMKLERLRRGSEDGQSGEVGSEVAAINGRETVGLHTGMGGDEEIRDEVLAWPALAPIAQEHLAGEVSGGGCHGIVGDTEGVELGECLVHAGKPDGTLGKNNGAKC